MPSTFEVAQLINGIYQYPGDQLITWDHLDTGEQDDGVYYGVKNLANNWPTVIFRGSKTILDWERDGLSAYWIDRDIGGVHIGMFLGIKDVYEEIWHNLVPYQWSVGGHSLGAARALDLAAVATVYGRPPKNVIVCGSPRPGFVRLEEILIQAGVVIESYRNKDDNGHDLVTDLPANIPLLAPFIHPGGLIDIAGGTISGDTSPFAYHHMPLYLNAIKNLPTK